MLGYYYVPIFTEYNNNDAEYSSRPNARFLCCPDSVRLLQIRHSRSERQ